MDAITSPLLARIAGRINEHVRHKRPVAVIAGCGRPWVAACRGLGLGRSPARPLMRDDGALVEDFAAPDSAWFGAFERADQAGRAQRTRSAVRLGPLELGGQFGEGAALAGCLAGLHPDDPDQHGDVVTPECVLVPGKLIGIDIAGGAGT